MRITSAGNIGVGLVAPDDKFEVALTTNEGVMFTKYSNDTMSARIALRKARGPYGAASAVLSGDSIGMFGGRGYGTSQWPSTCTASMVLSAAENFTNTANGTDILFKTSPIGSLVQTERARIM
jgi:hypothetical protein